MSLPFTGQNSLEGFAWMMSDLLWLNETSRRDPYFLYQPASANSGYAFGAVQWDIPNFAPFDSSLNRADKIFEEILLNARTAEGQRILSDSTVGQIINSTTRTGPAYSIGNSTALNSYITLINQALDSAYGRQRVDDEHVLYINAIVKWVNDTVALVTDPVDNSFLTDSYAARLFIGDIRNQFGNARNNNLRSYLRGAAVNLGTGLVQKVGQLGFDDILNFYFSTLYATKIAGLNDELRRFTNIFTVADSYSLPTDAQARVQEAKGLIRVFQDFLKDKKASLSYFAVFNTSILTHARTELITKYVNEPNLGITINGEVMVGEDQASFQRNVKHKTDADPFGLIGSDGSDLIFGESGNDLVNGWQGDDVLYGGSGDDTIRGHRGNDFLIGEAGDDAYYIGSLDGNDTIIDSDGKGKIIYESGAPSQVLALGTRKSTDPTGQYKSPDGTITYQVNGADLTITTPTNTLTVRNFNQANKDLGIRLIDLPAEPTEDTATGPTSFWGVAPPNPPVSSTRTATTTYVTVGGSLTVTHDWPPAQTESEVVFKEEWASTTTATNDQGTPETSDDVTITTVVDNWFYRNAQAQMIDDDGGHSFSADAVTTLMDGQGGDDTLDGRGVNGITLLGGAGDDTLRNGFILRGGDGDDDLYGDDDESEKLYGDADRDVLHGLGGDDLLEGGSDTDILSGGAGDDLIYATTAGDHDLIVQSVDNSAADPDQHDWLDGGSGNDFIVGSLGDDGLAGGGGQDVLIGGPGADNLLRERWGQVLQ